MTAPRLIRLVPTGHSIDGIDLVEPEEVLPLPEERVHELAREMVKGHKSVEWLCRALEKEHGIGRRMDA
ncbi:MAG: hypothetical protein RL442_6 [Pseudomonadota bacterium]|jgi:hypothetical protein